MAQNPRAYKQLRRWVVEASEMTSDQDCAVPTAAAKYYIALGSKVRTYFI